MISKLKEKFKPSLLKNQSEKKSETFFVGKVLVVDDVTVNRYILKKYIEKVRPDIQIYEASNGLTAIEMHQKYNVDMIFLDLVMSGMGGIEVAKIIKETDYNVKIIGCTGNIEKEVIKKCFEVGMIKVLGKPINKIDIEYILNGNNESIYD
jgi:two-component system response regulator VanR